MNLESIAKYFAPKSPMFSDSSRATATDNLTGTDVMAALGLVNAKCGFGFDLYGKNWHQQPGAGNGGSIWFSR